MKCISLWVGTYWEKSAFWVPDTTCDTYSALWAPLHRGQGPHIPGNNTHGSPACLANTQKGQSYWRLLFLILDNVLHEISSAMSYTGHLVTEKRMKIFKNICHLLSDRFMFSKITLLILWNSTAAEARVAWPQRGTSLAGVNHLNPKQEPERQDKPERDMILPVQVSHRLIFLPFSKFFISMN